MRRRGLETMCWVLNNIRSKANGVCLYHVFDLSINRKALNTFPRHCNRRRSDVRCKYLETSLLSHVTEVASYLSDGVEEGGSRFCFICLASVIVWTLPLESSSIVGATVQSCLWALHSLHKAPLRRDFMGHSFHAFRNQPRHVFKC